MICLKLEELLGSLMIHELILNQQEEEKVKKKKTIALAAEIKEEDREHSEDDRSDYEVILLARRIKNFMWKKRVAPRKKVVDRGETEKVGMVCYKCKKVGHLRIECPKFRKNPKIKKKALVATCSDSKESSSEDEHQECANLCLMAHRDEVNSDSNSDPSLDELYDALDDLMLEYKKLKQKSKDTNLLNQDLSKQLDIVTKEKEDLFKEN